MVNKNLSTRLLAVHICCAVPLSYPPGKEKGTNNQIFKYQFPIISEPLFKIVPLSPLEMKGANLAQMALLILH